MPELISSAHNTVPASPLSKPKALRVGGKLKDALNLIVWEGLAWNEAAAKANFTVAAMRKALERPHVIAYLKAQKQVFRASVSGQNISRLAEIRDRAGNTMAQLGAIKLLEQIDDDQRIGGSQQSTPGVTIIIGAPAVSAHIPCAPIDAKPLNSLTRVGSDDGSEG